MIGSVADCMNILSHLSKQCGRTYGPSAYHLPTISQELWNNVLEYRRIHPHEAICKRLIMVGIMQLKEIFIRHHLQLWSYPTHGSTSSPEGS